MDRCPVCQAELPANYAGANCPSCGVRLPSTTKSRISLTPLGMAKPKIPSERPPVAVDEDRWDISDDPAPALSAPVAPSAPPPPDPAAPASSRAHDPLRTTLALGNMPLPPPPATGVPSAGASHRPPPSAPGPVGAHREAPPTPTLALESKALHEMLVAKAAEASAARAAIEAAKATPSAAPPSAGVPATGKSRVGSTTLALDDAPPIKAPSSAALPGHSSTASKSERPATATMVFSPSELVKAANDKSKERVGSSTLAIEPNAPSQPPAAQGPSSAGRIGAPAANLSKTMVQGGLPSSAPVAAPPPAKPSSDASVNLRGTLVMAAPLAARPADPAPPPAQQGPTLTPTQAITQPKREAPAAKAVPHVSAPKDALSSTIVGMSPLAGPMPSASTALHAAPANAAKGPTAAAKSAPAPLDSLSQTLVGTSPIAAIADAVLSEKSQPDSTHERSAPPVEPAQREPERAAVEPARSSALSAPPARTTETLRDGSPDASARTTTTPHALAATLAHEPIEEKANDLGESYVSSPITRLPADETGRAAKEPARDSKPAEPRASRPVIAARTPSSGVDLPKKPAAQPQAMASASQERATEDEEPLEVGESALRVALAAAGTIVVSSAVPTLVRDPIGAATWTIPGVIALVLAFVPVGHATRALLAFAPALPALAVRAMGCEGHNVPGALALTALAAGLPAALLFRAYFTGLKRARALVAVALAIGAAWALLPGGGGVLGPSTGPWAASHLPALSFLAVAALSVTALLPGRSAGGAGGWALLAMAWTALPALGSRAEQFGPRALDALSLAGLSAIASTTLAGLLSVYALPEQAEPAQQ
ncbi:MAG: hypothetical protein U0269_17875 [Polyangiales bacterium]